jgi:hypothetical protein
MEVYFSGSVGRRDIPDERVVESSLVDVLSIFDGLRREGAFLGILLDGRKTLQLMMRSDGRVFCEILDVQKFERAGSLVSAALAKELIKAAFSGMDLQAFTAQADVSWTVQKIDIRELSLNRS